MSWFDGAQGPRSGGISFLNETTRYRGKIFGLTATNGMRGSDSQARPPYSLLYGRAYFVMSTISFYCVICGAALEAPVDSRYDLTSCSSCSRHVPVPRPVSPVGNFTRFEAVLPSSILELSLTFECHACHSRLQTDARQEGRSIVCPTCSESTAIPRWSTVPLWRSEETEAKAGVVTPRLSAEEIEFLRGEVSGEAV